MRAPVTIASGNGHIAWIDEYGHEWHRAPVAWRVDSRGETFHISLHPPGHHTIFDVPDVGGPRIRAARAHVLTADGDTINVGQWSAAFAPGDGITFTWGDAVDPIRAAVHQAVYDVLVDDPYHCDQPCCDFSEERETAFADLVDRVTTAAINAWPRS